jgi:hypothetical protein
MSASMNADTKPQIDKLSEDVRLRELGRISVINCLRAIAEQSTSHADAIGMARDQLSQAGVVFRHNPNLSAEEKSRLPSYFRFEPPLEVIDKGR